MSTSSLYGLIGFPLGHSFSKRYFSEKFLKLGISETHAYEQFPIPSMDEFPKLIQEHAGILKGINVTIPYKQQVIPFLDEIDPAALRIGAVNTIKILANGKTVGYNTDYFGFRKTLENWSSFLEFKDRKALVLGQGGAAKAIIVALTDLGISVIKVSRKANSEAISYEDVAGILPEVGLIVNTSPVGMHPNEDRCPPLPYTSMGAQHYFYDIVYNPLHTLFLKKGIESSIGGIHTGIEMLHGQADKAWEIWQA